MTKLNLFEDLLHRYISTNIRKRCGQSLVRNLRYKMVLKCHNFGSYTQILKLRGMLRLFLLRAIKMGLKVPIDRDGYSKDMHVKPN